MNNIEELLSGKFGLRIISITDAPRGFIADTYIVNTDNMRYFLKILKKNRYSVNVLQSLPVLAELKNLGIDSINYPIETINKQLYIDNGNQYMILFNYIEGENTWDYDVVDVYQKLIQIHKLTKDINGEVRREDFHIRYLEEFESSLDRYKDLEVIKEYIEDIKKYWKEFLKLSTKLSEEDFTMYLSHGDSLGNIIKDEDDLYIIDWDDLILAPLERDLWFGVENGGIVKLYKDTFKDYEVNWDVVIYYVYNRFFDDLLGFFELLDNGEDEIKISEDIKEDCLDWTFDLIRKYTKKDNS